MATSLQKQLAAIAVSSTHQLDLKAQKAAHGKSLLFESKIAASQSFENLYLICYEGYRDLCALDPRFAQFSKSLFSEQSKVEDRTQMTKKENEKLNMVLEAFITLVGPRLLLKPAEKALEWLVRRFQVHEYNTECLVLTYLPYHNTPQFLALLSILPAKPSPSLRFLFPYIQSPTNPPRQTIVYSAINTPAFFNALQSYVVKVLQAGHQGTSLVSFWSSVTAQSIDGVLDSSGSGRKEIQDEKTEELLLRVLPVLNSCMRLSSGAEMNTACYMIIIVLVTKAAFEDKVLDPLMEATILSQDSETLETCIMCLAIIAEERLQVPIPAVVSKRLLRIPNLAETLASLSKRCRVERLALGCVVNALGACSGEHRKVFDEILKSNILDTQHTQVALSALLQVLRDSTLGSEEHGSLLEIAAKLCELPSLSSSLSNVANKNGIDLSSLGLTIDPALESAHDDGVNSEDEEMIDADEEAIAQDNLPELELPSISTSSFLDKDSSEDFQKIIGVFARAVSTNQTTRLLSSDTLRRNEAFQDPLFFTFLVRTWCSPCPVSVRAAALRAATMTIKNSAKATDLQILIPYLLCALADSSPIVRRSAAACISVLSKTAAPKGKKGLANVYGKSSSNIAALSADESSSFLSSVVVPVLEECIMDPKFITTSIGDVLEGKQSSATQQKQGLKAALRVSILSFLGSHTALTPLLRARLGLLPIFNFPGKVSAAVRTNTILPIIREWSMLSTIDAARICAGEELALAEVERDHLASVLPREPESVALLTDIVSGQAGKERIELLNTAFDRLNNLWGSLKSDSRLSLGQSLLELTLAEVNGPYDTVAKERSLETLRNVKLDSTTLITFLESVPSAVQMPEGPPAKKRRRTSRNEMARVELQSPDDLSRLLRKLTLVLELIEGSNPGQHPELFKNLFSVLGELQQLKQQSGSELVYLQSLILSSLTPIVTTLREQKDTADYLGAVRADLLIDCIRHSASPQVQNSALLLIASLASWVPELILHNLMPIFTFIGSTLLRQQDDYSAHVVDQTISRVVPQLAASLRAKHKHFLTGVADLLLSFTAAFEHIPQHRRMKLFSELARTLGPEDSLSAIIALLVDRYHNSKTQRRFSTDLLLAFDPVLTLDAFKGYLDLVVDAAGPKRKVSDTLFGLNEKQPAQVESALGNLLSSLADLAAEERLRNHVTRAFRRKSEQHKPRETFATIVETVIRLSKQVAGQQKLYDGCSRVLARCLDLLPTKDLIQSAELLLSNSDHHVQIAAIKSVEVRAGMVVQNDRPSVSALLSFLPSIENVLQKAGEMDAKIISVSCIDRIIERFGKKDLSAVTSVAKTISGPQSLSSGDDRVRILSLLCLTSIVDVLEDEAISLLPTILPKAFEYLEVAIEQEKTGLHNAVYSLLSNVVERLGYMFSREYMVPALKLSQRSATANLEDACEESRRQFYQSVSAYIGPQEVFAATRATWHAAVDQGFEASFEQAELVRSSIESQSKSKLMKASASLFTLLLEVFDIRSAVESSKEDFDDEEVDQLESTIIEAVISMILKLNDATFRPFFVQLVDLVSSSQPDQSRSITFYKFLSIFFDKFKSIVTGYSSYVVEHAAKLLDNLSDESNSESELRNAVLSALQQTFKHDQDGFWQAPSHFGTIMTPLLKQLTVENTEDVTSEVISAITELAAASSSSMDNHREMNSILLKYMRAEETHTRLATVICEQSLTKRLGEEWLGLLPEMLPFISELREDDDEMVERETQRWITMVEQILGEDLDSMLQ